LLGLTEVPFDYTDPVVMKAAVVVRIQMSRQMTVCCCLLVCFVIKQLLLIMKTP